MFHGLIHNNGHPEQAIIVQTPNNHFFFRTLHMNTVALLTSFFSMAQGKMCGIRKSFPASNNDGSCLTENCEAESGFFSAAKKHTTHARICVIKRILWYGSFMMKLQLIKLNRQAYSKKVMYAYLQNKGSMAADFANEMFANGHSYFFIINVDLSSTSNNAIEFKRCVCGVRTQTQISSPHDAGVENTEKCFLFLKSS